MAVLRRQQPPVQRLQLRHRHLRREVRLLGAGQQLAQQHRPDQPAGSQGRDRVVQLPRLGRVPRDRLLRRRRPDGRPLLPLRRDRRLGPEVPRLLRRHTVLLRMEPQLRQGVPPGLLGQPPEDQPLRGAARPAGADRHEVRPGRRPLHGRLGQRLRPREHRRQHLPHRLRGRKPRAPGQGERQPRLGRGAADGGVLLGRLGRPRRRRHHLRLGVRRRRDLHQRQPLPHLQRQRHLHRQADRTGRGQQDGQRHGARRRRQHPSQGGLLGSARRRVHRLRRRGGLHGQRHRRRGRRRRLRQGRRDHRARPRPARPRHRPVHRVHRDGHDHGLRP